MYSNPEGEIMICRYLIPFLITCFVIGTAQAQWTEIAQFGGTATDGAVAFTIDGVAYVGGGPGVQQFYSYTPSTSTWKRLASIGGGPRGWAFGFAINGKGYIGGGDPAGNFQPVDDFWEYDPATNTWKQLGDFPGGNRDAMFSFAIGDKGYVGAGFDGTNSYSDFWSYKPDTDTWTYFGEYPGGKVLFPVSFVIDGKAYVGTGTALPEVDTFYEYDPQKGWTQKASFPGGARQAAVAFAADGKGYIGGGLNGPYQSATQYQDFYEYDIEANKWTKLADGDFPIQNLSWSSAFTINDVAYVGLGAHVPLFQFTGKYHKYQFGSELTNSLNGNMLSMGSHVVGAVKDSMISLSNTGRKAIIVTTIELLAVQTTEYSLTTLALPLTIEPGASIEITLSFAPWAAQMFNAKLRISSDASNGSVIDIDLAASGKVLSPEIGIDNSQLVFGSHKLGQTKDLELEIASVGDATLVITEVIIENVPDGVFTIQSPPSFPLTLEPGVSETLSIRFSPAAEANYSGRLVIASNADSGPETFATLTGSGVALTRLLVLDPDMIAFGLVEVDNSADKILRLKNEGEANVTVSGVQVEGADADAFSVLSLDLPLEIQAGASADITIQFLPDLAQEYSAELSLTSNATNGAVRTIALTGEGYDAPVSGVEFEYTSLSFGDVIVNTTKDTTLVIRSSGNANLRIESIALENNPKGSFSFDGITAPVSLIPNATKTVTLRFDPKQAGSASAVLRIATNANGSENVAIQLLGYGNATTTVESPESVTGHALLHLYPNPIQQGGRLHYSYSGETQTTVDLRVYDIYGRQVYSAEKANLLPGSHPLLISTALPTGMYYLMMRNGGLHSSMQFVVYNN
jgi:N-acetylneuraminic acid mutarotase